MKPQADGFKRAWLNTKDCSQVADQLYDANNVSSPVTNTASICVVLFIILASMLGWVVDVNGAFLLGEFKDIPITRNQYVLS